MTLALAPGVFSSSIFSRRSCSRFSCLAEVLSLQLLNLLHQFAYHVLLLLLESLLQLNLLVSQLSQLARQIVGEKLLLSFVVVCQSFLLLLERLDLFEQLVRDVLLLLLGSSLQDAKLAQAKASCDHLDLTKLTWMFTLAFRSSLFSS